MEKFLTCRGVERRAEDPAGDLSDRAVAAGNGGDRACGAAYDVVGARDRHGPAHEGEAREVVDVVADVEHALWRDALLLAPLLQCEVFPVDAVERRDLQLPSSGGDDRVLLRGQDQHREAALAEGRDAESVSAVHGDELPSVGVDQHPVVRLGAVEVEDDRVDVFSGREGAGPVRVEERREGPGTGEVVRVVDLQDPGGVGADEFRTAEEAVLVLAQPRRVHGVGGAGLQEVLGAVLAARAEGLVVVDAVTAVRGRGVGDGRAAADGPGALRVDGGRVVVRVAPDEAVEGRHGQRGVRAVLDDRAGDPVDVLADDEGAGALHEEYGVDDGAVQRLVGVHGVQDGGLGGGGVAGDGGGAQHDLRACLAGGGGDRLVVGGDDDVRHEPGRDTLAHRAGHQRYASDGEEVLGGDALGAAPRGDHREHPAHRLRPARCGLARLRVGHWLYSLRRVLDARGSRIRREGGHSSPMRRMTGATRCTPCR